MTAGSLAMQLIALRSASSGELVPAKEIEIELQGKARDALVEIWPPTSAEMGWPPAAAMTPQSIEDWTTMGLRRRRSLNGFRICSVCRIVGPSVSQVRRQVKAPRASWGRSRRRPYQRPAEGFR